MIVEKHANLNKFVFSKLISWTNLLTEMENKYLCFFTRMENHQNWVIIVEHIC